MRFVTYHTQKESSRYVLLKRIFKISAKFTGKHLCWSLFFNKLAGNFIKKEVFSCEFCGIFKNTCLEETHFFIKRLRWLLLCIFQDAFISLLFVFFFISSINNQLCSEGYLHLFFVRPHASFC